MLTKDFIENTFKTEIGQMTIGLDGKAAHAFIGFALISQSIEVLGACFDEYDWGDRNLCKLRFRLAISKLFPEKYEEFNNKTSRFDLYKNLRCPMAHQMRPGKFISLSERRHEENMGILGTHLTIQNNKLFLIYEDFWNDFKDACDKIIKMIENRNLLSGKVYGHNISVG